MPADTSATPRILYLYPGFVPPPLEAKRNKHFFLSSVAQGDILQPVWWNDPSELEAKLKVSSKEPYVVGSFRYHFFYAYRFPARARNVLKFLFYLRRGAALLRERRYDVIICYGTNAPGIAAALLSRRFGVPFIAEIPGVPKKAFAYEDIRSPAIKTLRQKIADVLLIFVLRRASHLRLLFPSQLDGYPEAQNRPSSVFHEFVAAGLIREGTKDERYVYFLGSPWYLKGVDVLLRAFRKVENELGDVQLKIVGHCADRKPFEAIAAGSTRIEFLPGKPHPEAMDLMSRCSVFVLPSRTEAMGCVMLEAMAAGKPVIGSAVDGITHYIEDGKNGLLFGKEDSDALAECLLKLFREPSFARQIAEEGRRRVTSSYSESSYAEQFGKMLSSVLTKGRAQGSK